MYIIYKNCPIYRNDKITLRLTQGEDTPELLHCYADKLAVPLFNGDNCNGDTFYYPTVERMKQAVNFWAYSYDTKQFVRMTIIWNATGEIIGTVEMFNRGATSGYGVHGVLRIDLMSRYENEEVLDAVLDLVEDHYYQALGVEWIMTKVVDLAVKRRNVLARRGYVPVPNFALTDYYGRAEYKL
jgi:RimJ/RimL family protein N-acetyltransferase